MKCDVCNFESETEVFAGRWIFYCKDHKSKDWEKTYENEIEGREDFDDVEGEFAEMMMKNM